MSDAIAATPKPVKGLYDGPMWESITAKRICLQRCSECSTFRYPPGPICSECLSDKSEWAPISGRGKVMSWVVFRRQYLPAYPPPYNVIAVQLEEGPIFISNLEGQEPGGSWIGSQVELVYSVMRDGVVLPRFALVR